MQRVWLIAQCASEFHLSPLAVACELDSDPEHTMLECLSFLRYAEAKAGLESKSEETRKAWEKHYLAPIWSLNTFMPYHERTHPTPVEHGCKMCHQKTTHPTPVEWCEDCG